MNADDAFKTIADLPHEMLADVAIKLGSQCLNDFASMKLSSKSLCAAGESKYVLQNIDLDNVEIDPWGGHPPHVSRILDQCFDAGNPDIYFMRGLKEFFTAGGRTNGFNLLSLACKKGQKEATYLVCMLGFCSGGVAQQQALQVLNGVKSQYPNWDYDVSREKIGIRMRSLWVYDGMHAAPFLFTCTNELHTLRRLRDMDFKEDAELETCSYCRWFRQFVLFARMLNIEI